MDSALKRTSSKAVTTSLKNIPRLPGQRNDRYQGYWGHRPERILLTKLPFDATPTDHQRVKCSTTLPPPPKSATATNANQRKLHSVGKVYHRDLLQSAYYPTSLLDLLDKELKNLKYVRYAMNFSI